jgi:hypothetical protein
MRVACVRVLPQLGVTDASRYLSSNSGGSWLNTAFSFQHKVRGVVWGRGGGVCGRGVGGGGTAPCTPAVCLRASALHGMRSYYL